MTRVDHLRRSLALAPWFVAGALLLGGEGPVAAQDAATPAPMTTDTEATEQTAAPAAETPAVGSGDAPSQVPRTGVGPGATSAGGPMSWGAIAGAVFAAAAALR